MKPQQSNSIRLNPELAKQIKTAIESNPTADENKIT